ncbi:MAG: Fe-S cluster assembly protein HesB [Bacteroidota bacterium]
MDAATNDTAIEKLIAIDRILCEHYGAPFDYFSTKDAVSELVSAMLSHRTRNKVSGQAYRDLKEKYPSWEELLVADVKEIESVIARVTYPEVKSNRIKVALQLVKDRNNGELSLEFLKDMPVQAARDWMEEIPGVGAKTSAAVLNFSHLRIPALVVDTHHQRVAQRVGLVPPKASIAKAAYQLQAMIPEDWDARKVYDNHEAFMYHGQKCCYYSNPECQRCPILHLCPFGQENLPPQ